MSLKSLLLAGVCAALPFAASGQMVVDDAYARAASPAARSGAAFMEITNPAESDDRVIGAASDAAERVELHTHIEEDGVMRMVHVEEGFPIAAGETIMLERGGRHVMLMGLRGPLEQGKEIEITLTFENAEPLTVTVPVDNERMPDMGMSHGTDG
jgi:hypothetical protein